jgi:hypothetical protein
MRSEPISHLRYLSKPFAKRSTSSTSTELKFPLSRRLYSWTSTKLSAAAGRPRTRQRYSIGHELGHSLIPTHRPRTSDGFSCSLDDLHQHDPKERDRRKRIEADANRFAAALLMSPRRIRAAMTSASPDLGEIVRLAHDFDVSKEAMARAYVGAQREAIAMSPEEIAPKLSIFRAVLTNVQYFDAPRNHYFPCKSIKTGN